MWANYFRPHIPMVLMDVSDVENYISKGLSHATAADASSLPGYTPIEALTPQQMDLMANEGPATGADAPSWLTST